MNIHNSNINEQKNNKKIYNIGVDRKCGPYYDPRDIHIHEWVFGNIIPQNSYTLQLDQTKKKQNDVTYCIVCHEVKNEINTKITKITSVYKIDMLSNIETSNTKKQEKDIFEDSITIVDHINNSIKEHKVNKEYTKNMLNKVLESKLFIMPEITNNLDSIVMFSED